MPATPDDGVRSYTTNLDTPAAQAIILTYARRDTFSSSLGTPARNGDSRPRYLSRTVLDSCFERIRPRPALPRSRSSLRFHALLEFRRLSPHRPGRPRHAPLLVPPGQSNPNRKGIRNPPGDAQVGTSHVGTASQAVQRSAASAAPRRSEEHTSEL